MRMIFAISIRFLLILQNMFLRQKEEGLWPFPCPLKITDLFLSMVNKERIPNKLKKLQLGHSRNGASCGQHLSLSCCWPIHSLTRHWLHPLYRSMDFINVLLLRNWPHSSAVELTSMWASYYGCNVRAAVGPRGAHPTASLRASTSHCFTRKSLFILTPQLSSELSLLMSSSTAEEL